METAFTPIRHKFTVDDYHKMGEVGILSEDDRVELIDGELMEMAPVGVRHAWTVTLLAKLLQTRVGDDAVVWSQNPVSLPPRSEPEPDFALLRTGADLFFKTLPRASDTLLVIEVSDSTIGFDRLVKQRMYARDGIPEYWIVNLTKRVVEIYRAPEGEQYTEIESGQMGARISPNSLPQLIIEVAEIFPDIGND